MTPVFHDLSPRDRDTLVRILKDHEDRLVALTGKWVDASGQRVLNAPSAGVGSGFTNLNQVRGLIDAAVDSAVKRLKDDNDLE